MTAVLLSVSGETSQILHLARQFKARGCNLIAITSSAQSSLAQLSDITLPYYATGTGNRYKKKSFDWYKKVIATNGEDLG